VSRRGAMRERKRLRDIAVEIAEATEECAFAAEVVRRSGWDGVSNQCGCRGLEIR
jgi:hypothetical protein